MKGMSHDKQDRFSTVVLRIVRYDRRGLSRMAFHHERHAP